MKIKIKHGRILSSILLFIIYAVLIFNNYYTVLQNRSEFLERRLIGMRENLQLSKYHFEKLSQLVFNEIIDEYKIDEIIYKAGNTNHPAERQKYRNELQGRMSTLYQKLLHYHFRQMHFHLKDNRSFLRMHRPEKYGDDLSEFRATVADCNQKHIPVQGFEEGRIFNGYRYVHPIHYQENHVGSVEISVSFNAFGTMFKNIKKADFLFMVNENIVQKKVFNSELENYKKVVFNTDYMYDLDIGDPTLITQIEDNDQFVKLSQGINAKMNAHMDFTECVKIDKRYFLLYFLNIENYQNFPAAYFILKVEEPFMAHFVEHRMRDFILITTVFLGLAIALHLVFYYRKKYQEQKYNIPMCSSCKKVRTPNSDPQDVHSWIPIEKFVFDETGSHASHGLCPTCLRKLYPDQANKVLKK